MLVAGVLALLTMPVDRAAPGGDARDQGQDAHAEGGRAEGHKEVPVEPPSTPVLREHQGRSPRAIVLRGLHRSV
jgi:hypothetical protein